MNENLWISMSKGNARSSSKRVRRQTWRDSNITTWLQIPYTVAWLSSEVVVSQNSTHWFGSHHLSRVSIAAGWFSPNQSWAPYPDILPTTRNRLPGESRVTSASITSNSMSDSGAPSTTSRNLTRIRVEYVQLKIHYHISIRLKQCCCDNDHGRWRRFPWGLKRASRWAWNKMSRFGIMDRDSWEWYKGKGLFIWWEDKTPHTIYAVLCSENSE